MVRWWVVSNSLMSVEVARARALESEEPREVVLSGRALALVEAQPMNHLKKLRFVIAPRYERQADQFAKPDGDC